MFRQWQNTLAATIYMNSMNGLLFCHPAMGHQVVCAKEEYRQFLLGTGVILQGRQRGGM